MFKGLLICIFLCLTNISFSQNSDTEEDYVNDNVLKYDDVNYKPAIKTVQIHEATWEYSAPIINLNSNEQIELSFDDIDGDQKQYSLSFIHCNADWSPSELMFLLEV